jgi:hypothetical protein
MFALLLLGGQFQWNYCALESKRCDHDRCFSGPTQQVGSVSEADGVGFQMGFFLRYRFQFRLRRVIHTGRVGQERTTSLHKTRTVQSGRSQRILQRPCRSRVSHLFSLCTWHRYVECGIPLQRSYMKRTESALEKLKLQTKSKRSHGRRL